MDVKMFLSLLSFFSALNILVVENTKTILSEKHVSYSSNLVAIIEGFIIGTIGTILYFILNNMIMNTHNIIFALLMGGAASLTSMQSYDKIVQLISQIKK